MDPQLVARQAHDLLLQSRSLDVIAVWADGSVTVERFAFWGRKLGRGRVQYPIASFVVGPTIPRITQVEKAIREGLLAARESGERAS